MRRVAQLGDRRGIGAIVVGRRVGCRPMPRLHAGVMRARASVGILAIISLARRLGAGDQPGMSAASGRLRQYFFGISFCIAFTFSRAGLKMFA